MEGSPSRAQKTAMCNLYNASPKEEVERYFRASVKHGSLGSAYPTAPVGPFGSGVFIRAGQSSQNHFEREAVLGQWGMIAPGAHSRRPDSRSILTNNARIEGVAQRPTYRAAWARGQRCLIPAQSFQEPNWETGRNIWWTLKRADGAPWALAGIWSEWQDPQTGEIVPSYSMLTMNCDEHPLLNRLHKPDPKLPPTAQDKRSTIPVEPELWDVWLNAPLDEAFERVVKLPPVERFDASVAAETDALLARLRQGGASKDEKPGPRQDSLF